MSTQEKTVQAGTGTASSTAFAGQIVAEIPKNSRELVAALESLIDWGAGR